MKSISEHMNESMNVMVSETGSIESIISVMAELELSMRVGHYLTRSHAKHEASGLYTEIVALMDDIVEKSIGYYGATPKYVSFKSFEVSADTLENLGDRIISTASFICSLAKSNDWGDVENLSQELSGIGAKLKYLFMQS